MATTLQTGPAANNFLIVPKSKPAENATFKKPYSFLLFLFKSCTTMARTNEEQALNQLGILFKMIWKMYIVMSDLCLLPKISSVILTVFPS